MLANKTFIDFIVKIIAKDKFKTKVVSFLYNAIFLFMYNVKTTILSQFLNLEFFHINNF